MEPQYYYGGSEQLRNELKRTNDAKWAVKFLVYGAVNRLPGWPSLWELMVALRGEQSPSVVTLARVVAARVAANAAGQVVCMLPSDMRHRVLTALRRTL
jgi:hypothetical protein